MVFGGLLLEDILDLGDLGGGDNRYAWLKYASLMGGDFLKGVAQVFGVLELDWTHGDSLWRDDVCDVV